MCRRVLRAIKRGALNYLSRVEYSFKASRISGIFFYLLRFVGTNQSYEKIHYLLPHPGNGNLGDQAMVESFINYFNGNCILIVEDEVRFKLTNRIIPEPRCLEIPNLIFGNALQSFIAMVKFVRISGQMKSFSVIGADVMDGVYNLRESVNRLFLLRIINSIGIDSRITGFSWSPDALPITTRLMRIISETTKLCVRDPRSVGRLKHAGISSVVEVADLVFADNSVSDSILIESWEAASCKPTVIVNISGLRLNQEKNPAQHLDEYKTIVKYLHSQGYRILILPHVFRVGDGDIEISQALYDSSCNPDDMLITEPFSPSEERRLLRNVYFVITGRMHIAVLALNTGKPVIALETMGKVQGLFELFGIEPYCVFQEGEFSKGVIERIDWLSYQYSSVSAQVSYKRSHVKELSQRNFIGLT